MGRPAPWGVQRVLIAERVPGWTLDYIDNLNWEDLLGVLQVLSSKDKAQADEVDSQKWRSAAKGRAKGR